MSRSFKKNSILKENGKAKNSKKIASRTIRRKCKDIDFPSKGNYYRRLFPQYEIHDYVIYSSLREAIDDWEQEGEEGWRHYSFKTFENYLNYWYKIFKRK